MTKARDLANASTALSAVSATELAFVDGVTSAIQTQMDAKAPSSTAVTLTGTQTLTNKTLTSPALTTPTISTATTNGDILYGTGSGALARLGIGSTDQVLKVTAGVPAWATPSSGALTLTSSTSFSAVSSHSVNNCFSATYDNYRIVVTYSTYSGTNNAQVRMRLRVGGVDNTGNYYTANNYYYSGTTTDTSYANTNGFLAGHAMNHASEGNSINIIDIMEPFVAGETPMTGYGQTFFSNVGNSIASRFSGLSFAQTSYDGFTLIPADNTITGKVRVYGYSN